LRKASQFYHESIGLKSRMLNRSMPR